MVFKRHLIDALLMAILTSLVGISWLAHHNMGVENESEQGVTNTRVVIQELGDLLSDLKDAETGQRGFIITGDPEYLEPYHAGVAAFPTHLANLRRLTADNPRQQQRLDAITPLIASRLAILKEIIALRETQGFPTASAALMAQPGKIVMDQIRVLVAQAQAQEAQLLIDRSATAASNARKTWQSVVLGGSLGAFALALLFIRLRLWELASGQRAQTSLRQRTAQFETLLNEAPLGVYLVDADLRICQANPIARQAFGNIPDLIGSDCDVLLHLAWPAAVADEQVRLFRHTLDTGEPYVSCDFSWQRFDRNVTEYYDWQINRIALPDGGYGVVCYFCDISERVVAQQKIRESEERFRSILHQSPAGIVQTDATGCLTLMNDRWCQILGYPEAEMVGRSVLEFTHPSSVEATATAFGALAAGGPDFQIDKHYSRKDGTILAAQSNVSAIRSPSGDFLGIIAVVMDMSERLRFEDTLRQSEQRLRALVTASSDVIYRMSPDWRELRELHGQDFIADTTAPNANWLQKYIHPDDQQRVLAVIDQAIQSKSLFELEHQVVTVDASLSWSFSRAVPILDANGNIVEWFGTASDVTEQKRAAQALQESELRYRNLFNSIDEGFCVIEMLFDEHKKPIDFRFLEVNPAFERQTGLIDATGKRARELIPDVEAYWIEIYGKVALTGEAIRFTNKAKALDERWFDLYALPLGGSQSRRVAVLFNNVTERKEAEKSLQQAKVEAEQANNAKSRFLAAASHDLRQPLAALSLYTGMLKNTPVAADQKLVANMQVCIDDLSELLNDLLDLSKLEAGVLIPIANDFAIADLFDSLASVHAPEALVKGLSLRFVAGPWTCRTDLVLLRRCLGNLVENAIRYTEHGGVLVACRRRQGKTWVEVWDTGIGIAADKTTEVFEEFNQLGDQARNNGSGLGLAIVAKTVALLGLSISVRSRAGRGSVFAIEIPVLAVPVLAVPVLAVPALAVAHAMKGRSLRIALVEDNEIVREALVEVLQRLGHQLVATVTKAALLKELDTFQPDIVVSDYRLTGGETGFDVITAVRARLGPEFPALILTGDTDPKLLRSMNARGIFVMHKSLNLDVLQATLEKLTGQMIS